MKSKNDVFGIGVRAKQNFNDKANKMKRKYTAPRINVISIDHEGCSLLAASNDPDSGMTLPNGSRPGVSGDAKSGVFRDEDFGGFTYEIGE